MRKIIAIQHPQSEQHVNKMIGSWGEWDLTELGITQAENIARNLWDEVKGERFALYASDLPRTRHTAEIISAQLGLEFHLSPLLREFDLGEANGKSKQWARQNILCPVWPGTIDWAADADGRMFRGAETRREVWRRVEAFLERTAEEENMIVVSHDGTLSLLFAMWLRLSIEMLNSRSLSGRAGGVSILLEDAAGNRILSKLNDMSYAEKLIPTSARN